MREVRATSSLPAPILIVAADETGREDGDGARHVVVGNHRHDADHCEAAVLELRDALGLAHIRRRLGKEVEGVEERQAEDLDLARDAASLRINSESGSVGRRCGTAVWNGGVGRRCGTAVGRLLEGAGSCNRGTEGAGPVLPRWQLVHSDREAGGVGQGLGFLTM